MRVALGEVSRQPGFCLQSMRWLHGEQGRVKLASFACHPFSFAPVPCLVSPSHYCLAERILYLLMREGWVESSGGGKVGTLMLVGGTG